MKTRFPIPVFFLALLCVAPKAVAHQDQEEVHLDRPPGIKCGFHHNFEETRDKKHDEITAVRPGGTDRVFVSPSGRFAIHYSLSGPHAVDPRDDNGNDVPDFVDSAAFYFDYAHEQEMALGFEPPPDDFNGGGTPQYDVYLQQLGTVGNGVYGLMGQERDLGSTNGHRRYTSYIIIDNDFSPLDSVETRSGGKRASYFETGYRALRVTSAHEYHHAIQVGAYGRLDECALHEFVSTWMEYRVHPDVRDFEQFVPVLLRSLPELPFGSDNCLFGYHYGALAQHMYDLYGDFVFVRWWELTREERNGYDAMDLAFKEEGGSLAEVWCSFSAWLYYTGYRAQEGRYLDRAEDFPTVTFAADEFYSEPSITISGGLRTLEARFVRLILPTDIPEETADTLDIGLSNIDVESAGLSFNVEDLPVRNFTVVCTPEEGNDGAERISGTNYFLKIIAPDDDICHTLFFNNGIITRDPGVAFPNPFVPRRDEFLYLPIASGIDPVRTRGVVTIFNSAMETVFSDSRPIEVRDDLRVIAWDGRARNGGIVQSGVYIFTVDYGDESVVGKFLVKSSE